ncbi:MAG TPA: YceI family protein [Flavobacteriales bacterium]|jgi:polyisoprenoid-binding protein YceI|nr:YceI family protein [Flavobacteriales bacterium]
MKPFLALTAAAAVMSIVACGPSQAELDAAKQKAMEDSIAAAAAAEHTYNVDVAASKVNWAGTMVGVKTHTGSLNFASGTITTKGPTLTGGEFTVDMKSYAMTDTNYAADGAKQGTRANLMQHLMSPDFFNTDSFPTATFKVTSVNGNTATGDFTVRGKTNQENVTDIVVTPNADGTVKATGKLVFDRQKYNVSWSAGKDAVVNDNVELNIELTGKAQ